MSKKHSGKSQAAGGYILSGPAVILLIVFLIVPIIMTIYYSFFTYQVMRPDHIIFKGFKNYVKLG